MDWNSTSTSRIDANECNSCCCMFWNFVLVIWLYGCLCCLSSIGCLVSWLVLVLGCLSECDVKNQSLESSSCSEPIMDVSEALFVDDGEDSYDVLDVFGEEQAEEDQIPWTESGDVVDSDSDSDMGSDSTDSDLEDVPLKAHPQSFLIAIEGDRKNEEAKRKRKLKRNKRLAIHNLGMVAYMAMATKRNNMLRSKKVLKTLKRLLPLKFMAKHVKPFKKSIVKQCEPDPELDKHLIYIIKYLIKWFRLNYRVDSNGLRVLGYLPEDVSNSEEYYPPLPRNRIGSVSEFCRVIKHFKHNRDTGSQIFTGLLRAIGFDARMVFAVPLLPVTASCTYEQPKMNGELLRNNKDNDLLYPYFWTELINPLNPQEIIVIEPICFHDEVKQITRIHRTYANKDSSLSLVETFNRNTRDQLNIMPPLQYVSSFDSRGLVLDVSPRYMVDVAYRYFGRLDLRTDTGRSALLFQSIIRCLNTGITYNELDNLELDCLRQIAFSQLTIPQTLAGVRKNPNVVSRKCLRYNEALQKNPKSLKQIKLNDGTKQNLYLRNQVVYGRSEQQWKLLARSIKPDQIDIPIKAHNSAQMLRTKRRKLLNFHDDLTTKVALYSFEQTCPYIRQEVVNGKIPRNEYGNIEIFSPVMIPTNCTWITWSYIELILRSYSKGKVQSKIKEDIEYVPVVTGFDFRTKPGYAVPIRSGVLVLTSQLYTVRHIWLSGKMQIDRQHLKLKRIRSLRAWSELISKLRIARRLDARYGKHEG